MALAATCALAACGADPKPDIVSEPAPRTDTALRNRIDGGPPLFVAGEELDVALLQKFYVRHGFEPVWTTQQAQANSLVDAVLRAGDQGLDPELFHATLLRRREMLPPLHRDLLLSDAFLSYADALARGAVPLERRQDDQVLTPEPIDVAAVLDEAAASADPGAVIEALAPTTPTYRALRQALQTYRSGAPAGDKAATNHLRTIVVNLERQRWLPRPLPGDRAWVNVAAERLALYRANRLVFSTRVVVGQDVERNQTPEFRATIDASFFNPPWVVPADIAKAEILPKLGRDADYLTRNRMVLLTGGEVEQLPGPDAGLGLIMFDMPNRFDVYLHDTPDRYIFNRDNRRISHGCIRVQNPL
ncbi:MAG TPA: L,D-transpeptidase family protein, partial [Acetobacteraceae bacterium]